jgi:hypothetical protein
MLRLYGGIDRLMDALTNPTAGKSMGRVQKVSSVFKLYGRNFAVFHDPRRMAQV